MPRRRNNASQLLMVKKECTFAQGMLQLRSIAPLK